MTAADGEQTLLTSPRDSWRLVVVQHRDHAHPLVDHRAHPACRQWRDPGTTSDH